MDQKKLAILVLFITTLLFWHCKKDHDVLGVEAQPENDILKSEIIQNQAVFYHSFEYDSVISLNTDSKFIGSNNDGQIGAMDVGLYTNINMNASNVNFGSDAQLLRGDIILPLHNTNLNGNTNAVLTYSVFALDSVLDIERAYYTNNKKLHNPGKLLGSVTTGTTLTLRIPMDYNYCAGILSNPADLVSNATFQKAHKGFYIVASNNGNEGIICQTDLSKDTAGFYLRYKRPAGSTKTDSVFQFRFSGSTAVRYNTVTFKPSAGLQAQFNGDTIQGKQRAYLKGMGGARMKVQIPFLKNYGDTFRVAVSRAELVINLDRDYVASIEGKAELKYPAPPTLALLAMDSLGRELLTLDQRNLTYISRYDGKFDYDKLTGKYRYKFNFPLQAQEYLNGQRKNYGFYLIVTDPTPPNVAFRDKNIEGCILAGYESAFKPVFNLTYVRLKQD